MNAKPHLHVIIPRGECLRNFLYSGVLATCRQQATVSMLSVIPSEEIRTILNSECDQLDPLEKVPQDYRVRITREILGMAHGRHLWSAAAKARWQFRRAEADTFGKLMRLWGKRLLCYPFANRQGMKALHNLETWASRKWPTTNRYRDYFLRTKPDWVFNASHVHSAIATPAIHAARELGIPTVTFLFSWDNLTSQGPIFPLYDHYLVWNQEIADQLMTIYPQVKPEQITVTGTPQFDAHFTPSMQWSKERFCKQVGADPARPIVLYTTGMANHMPSEEVLVESIADMLTDLPQSPQLMVRVYAKDRTQRFDSLVKRRPDILFPKALWEMNWLTPLPEDGPLWTNMVRYCDVGINVASTVSLELFMFGKPTINVAYNPPGVDISPKNYASYYSYDHYEPVAQSGGLALVRSPQEMKQAIATGLKEPKQRYHHQKALLDRFFGDTLDGQSAKRVAETLLEIMTSKPKARH